ncbi:hypothetical protein Aperf_G00000114551 [Anoplocephala perfoliata]
MEKARERLLAFQAWDSWTSNFSADSFGDSVEIRRLSGSAASSEGEVELSPAKTARFPNRSEIQAPVPPKTPDIRLQVKDSKTPKVNSRESPPHQKPKTLSAIEYITRDLDNDTHSSKCWNNCQAVESDSETESVAFLHLSELRSDTDESLPLSHVSPPKPPQIVETEKSARPSLKVSEETKEEATNTGEENTKMEEKSVKKIGSPNKPNRKKSKEKWGKERPRRHSKSERSDFKKCLFASCPKEGPEKFLKQLAKKGIRVEKLGETCTLINVVQAGEISGSENDDKDEQKMFKLSQVKPLKKILDPEMDAELLSILASRMSKQKDKSAVEISDGSYEPSNHGDCSEVSVRNHEKEEVGPSAKEEIVLREYESSLSPTSETEPDEPELFPRKDSTVEPRKRSSKIRPKKTAKMKGRSGTPHKTHRPVKEHVKRGDIKLKRHRMRFSSANADGEFEHKKGKYKRGRSKGKKRRNKERELCKERGDESEKTPSTKHGNQDCVVRKRHDFPKRSVHKRKRSKSLKVRKRLPKVPHTADKSTQTDKFYCKFYPRQKRVLKRRVCKGPINLQRFNQNNNATSDFETRRICGERNRKRGPQKLSYRGDTFVTTNPSENMRSPEPLDDCIRVKWHPHYSSRFSDRGDQTGTNFPWFVPLISSPKGTPSCRKQPKPVKSTSYTPKLHSRSSQKLSRSKIVPTVRSGFSFKDQIQKSYKKRNPSKIEQIISDVDAKYAFNIRDYANYFRALRNENNQDYEKVPRIEYSRCGQWTQSDAFEFEEFVCFVSINSADIDDTVIPFRVSIARHKILARIFNILKGIQGVCVESESKVVRAGDYLFDMRSPQIWSEIGTLPVNHPVRKMLRSSKGPQDRRIFAIENEIVGRILLAEEKVVFIKGNPCFQVHIFAPSTKAISVALMQIKRRLPTLYSKLIMTERLPKVHGGWGDKTTPAPTTANFTVEFGSSPRLSPRATLIHVPMTAKPKDRRDYVSYCGA